MKTDHSLLVSQFQNIASLLDENALISLSNKGLVRRARKDVALCPPELLEELDQKLKFQVEANLVTISKNPLDSTCNCKTSGICHHIIATWIFLAQNQNEQSTEISAQQSGHEILAVSKVALRSFIGSTLWKQAYHELATGLPIQYKDGATWIAHIPQWQTETRFLQGGSLDSMLCSCHAKQCCLHKAVTLIDWHIQHQILPPAIVENQQSDIDSPRTREEVTQAVKLLVIKIITHGFSRLTKTTMFHAQTLAASAHGVDLPRLEKMLRGLANEVSAWLSQSVVASEKNLLYRCASIYALGSALKHPTPALIGVHRNHFERISQIELIGMGAKTWRSTNGYQGLTVYFFEKTTQTWNTWTDTRPEGKTPFQSSSRYWATGPWNGCESPAVASRSHIRLQNAWRSRKGQLSGRDSTQFLLLGPSAQMDLPNPIEHFQDVMTQARKIFSGGLTEMDVLSSCVLIKPILWHAPFFHTIQQQFQQVIEDSTGKKISLRLPQTAENQAAISDLERKKPTQNLQIFGLLRAYQSELFIEPISLIENNQIFSLGLDSRPPSTLHFVPPQTFFQSEQNEDHIKDIHHHEDNEHEIVPNFSESQNTVSQLLQEIWNELEMIAAGGILAFRSFHRFIEYAERAELLQLQHMTSVLTQISQTLGQVEHPENKLPSLLLRTTWMIYVTQQTALMEQASLHHQ